MVAILGPDGRPFSRNGSDPGRLKDNGYALKQVQTFSGVVGGIAKTYRWAFDEALRNSPQNALSMRRDGAIMALLQERQVPVANAKYHLEPEQPEDPYQQSISDQLTDIVNAIPRFSRFRLQLLEAVWFGRYGNQYAVGKRQVKGQTRFTVLNHQPVHGDKFVYRWDGTPGILISQLYSANYGGNLTGLTANYTDALRRKGGVVLPTDRGMALFLETPQWRDRFAIHMHVAEDADFTEPELAGGIYGTGLRSRVYWLWWLRQEVLSWLIDYLARVGAGGLTLVGFEYGNAGSYEQAKSVAEQLETGNVILVPKPIGDEKLSATIERLEPSQAGSQVIMEVVQTFFDAWLERLIVGQSMSGGADNESGLGGSGRANFAADTKNQLLQMDAEALDECITEQLIQPLKRWNFPNATFKVRFKTDLSKPNPKDLLEAAKTIVDMGGEVIAEEVMEIAGLSMPEPGDETLGGQPDPAMAGAGGEEAGAAPGEEDMGGGGPEQELFDSAMKDGSLFSHEGLQGIKAKLGAAQQAPGAVGAKPGGLPGKDKAKKYAKPFEESKHKRGQPKNKGQFGPGGGGSETADGNGDTSPPSGHQAAGAPSAQLEPPRSPKQAVHNVQQMIQDGVDPQNFRELVDFLLTLPEAVLASIKQQVAGEAGGKPLMDEVGRQKKVQQAQAEVGQAKQQLADKEARGPKVPPKAAKLQGRLSAIDKRIAELNAIKAKMASQRQGAPGA